MFISVLNKTDPNRCNCVKFCRAHYPSLPSGLWWYWQKKNIINSSIPQKDCVAIMFTGWRGHCGIVQAIEDNLITIIETNFYKCTTTQRTGTEEELKIAGYFI